MHLQRQRYKPGDLAWAFSPLAFKFLERLVLYMVMVANQ